MRASPEVTGQLFCTAKVPEPFYVYGFSKKGRVNLEDYEVREYKKSAKIILKYSDEELAKFIKNGVFQTVSYHEKDQDI